MIDLDNFKWYNDTFGHQEGDKLLKSFGEILWKNVRNKIDKVCRYGGDEFVIILPYTFWRNV
jgi:diguanylate cyclase (GGDEF)-like protein